MNLLRRKPLIPGVLVLVFTLGVWLPACAAQDDAKASSGSSKVLAVVNGKPLTEADVRASSEEQFKALERDYQQKVHELLENALDQAVQDRLLEAEAATRGITKEALVA